MHEQTARIAELETQAADVATLKQELAELRAAVTALTRSQQ
jgi:hypothetical protein